MRGDGYLEWVHVDQGRRLTTKGLQFRVRQYRRALVLRRRLGGP